MERPNFDLGTILESPIGPMVQFQPVKRKSIWQSKKLSYSDLLDHTAEDIDPRVLLMLQWTLVVPAKLDIEGMKSEGVTQKLSYRHGFFVTLEEVEKVIIPEIYEPDFEHWNIKPNKVVYDDVSDFLATKLALFSLKNPNTKLPIMDANELGNCAEDLVHYMTTPREIMFRAHSGVQNIVSPKRVQQIINAGIITPEDRSDYFASISYWAKSFARFFGQGQNTDKTQTYPFSLVTQRQNYDLHFLPFLVGTHLQYLAELPELVQEGQMFDPASLKSSTTHLGIAVQNSLRTHIVERIGMGIKATDGSIGNLFNQLKILNPESAREVADVIKEVQKMNPLVRDLFEVFRTNPWLLNRIMPGWDQKRVGALPHLATISNEINQYGARVSRLPEYFRVKFNTKSGQI